MNKLDSHLTRFKITVMFDYSVTIPFGRLEESISWCRIHFGPPNEDFKIEHSGVWMFKDINSCGYIEGWEIHFRTKDDYTLFILSMNFA